MSVERKPDHMQISSLWYPTKCVEAFMKVRPMEAKRLENWLSGQHRDMVPFHMFEAFYEGWKAREDQALIDDPLSQELIKRAIS